MSAAAEPASAATARGGEGGGGGGVDGLDTGGPVDVDGSRDLVRAVGPDQWCEQHERAGHVEFEPVGCVVGQDGWGERPERLAVFDAVVECLRAGGGAGVGEDAAAAEGARAEFAAPLDHFAAAQQAEYSAAGHVRDSLLYLTRTARAHLELGDLDAACETATEAFRQNSGVNSARLQDARQHKAASAIPAPYRPDEPCTAYRPIKRRGSRGWPSPYQQHSCRPDATSSDSAKLSPAISICVE
jgi:hypothetical protein